MATVQTSATSYASPTDFMVWCPPSKIGAWAAMPGLPALTRQQILTDAVVGAVLLGASGLVEAYCTRGKRYTPTILAQLTGATQGLLKKLVSKIAYQDLAERYNPGFKTEGFEKIMETLKSLQSGELIFGIVENAAAGVMSAIDQKTDSRNREQRVTDRYRRIFGAREHSGES